MGSYKKIVCPKCGSTKMRSIYKKGRLLSHYACLNNIGFGVPCSYKIDPCDIDNHTYINKKALSEIEYTHDKHIEERNMLFEKIILYGEETGFCLVCNSHIPPHEKGCIISKIVVERLEKEQS